MAIFSTRSQAARAAKKAGESCFRTQNQNGGWVYRTLAGPKDHADAVAWAKSKDFVAWVEVDTRDEGRTPGYDSVLIITCKREEIDPAEWGEINTLGYLVKPITPELFDSRQGSVSAPKPSKPRERSTGESPTKRVWEIADTMPDAPRDDIVAACVAQGINESTAKTQFYRWKKAQTA